MKPKLEAIANALFDTYGTCIPAIHHIERGTLPSRSVIVNLMRCLREVIFPGYYGMAGFNVDQVRRKVIELLEEIEADLTTQIMLCLCHERGVDFNSCGGACREEANGLTTDFLAELPTLRRMLASDVEAAYDGDPAAKSFDEIILSYPGLQAIMTHRIAHALHRRGVPLIPRIMSEYTHGRTGIDIHPGAAIGEGFFIDHGTGVVIGETSVIGNRVKLYQGVTLGALRVEKSMAAAKWHPTIEDGVVIYANATILGGDTVIGRGSIIGGNVWLTHSIPPGTKVTVEK